MECKIYFYNGFDKPKLLANSVDELFFDWDLKITDNYRGDLTLELISDLKELRSTEYDIEDLNFILNDYSMFADPKLKDFKELNKYRYGLDEMEYLEDFEQSCMTVNKFLKLGGTIEMDIQQTAVYEIDEHGNCIKEIDTFSHENTEYYSVYYNGQLIENEFYNFDDVKTYVENELNEEDFNNE